MKKTDTIALYRDEYLAGKDDEARRAFDEKSVERQYSCIVTWRRRRKLTAPAKNDTSSPTAIADSLRKLRDALHALPSLADSDRQKILEAAEAVADDVRNFDRIKKGQLLRELQSEQEKMNREREQLEQRINALRQDLGDFGY